jgi:hypothetical protein
MPQRRYAARSHGVADKEESVVVPLTVSQALVEPVMDGSLTLDEPLSIDSMCPKMKHWKESPFAVGAVGVTWDEECSLKRSSCDQQCCREDIDANCCICCSGLICGKLGAGRVGNMAVLRESTEWVEHVEHDEETGEERVLRKYQRPRLDCVVGPYWPMLLCITYPLIFGVSLWTLLVAIPSKHVLIQLVWGACTVGLIYALAKTACTDPGILYRHPHPPPQDENQWQWSDQGQTYRPRGAYFDNDCAVVVEDFDHT